MIIKTNVKSSIITTLFAVVILLIINSIEPKANSVYNVFFILLISPIFFTGFWLWGYIFETILEKRKIAKNIVSYILSTFIAISVVLFLIYSFSTDNEMNDTDDDIFPYSFLFFIVTPVSLCYGISKWYFDKKTLK